MAALIYHTGALGDFITSLPAISLFRHRTGENELVLLGRKKFALLAIQYGYIDQYLDIDSSIYSFLSNDSASAKIFSFFNRFSSALLFTYSNSPIAVHARHSQHLNILIQDPFPDTPMPVIKYHLSLISNDYDFTKITYPLFPYVQTCKQHQITIKSPSVIIGPGSGSQLKNWPFQSYRSVAKQLESKGIHVYWVIGEAESNLQFTADDNVIRNYDITSLVDIFHQCTLYLGNDSGITHLAAGSSCKVITIFGPSDPRIWTPAGPNVHVLYKTSCRPCHENKINLPGCDKKCLQEIGVDEVVELIVKIIRDNMQ